MFHVKHSEDVREICRRNGLDLTDEQMGLLEAYVALLLEWNAKVNLVSRKDQENIWHGHILHSLSGVFRVRFAEKLRVLDLGSGGGIPGVPLAVVYPGWSVALLDSIQKKCVAVQDMVTRLGLSGRVEVIAGRAEEKGVMEGRRGTFDVVVARGVAPLADLVKWSGPWLRGVKGGGCVEEDGGRVLRVTPPVLFAYKGGDLAGEVQQMKVKTGRSVAGEVALEFAGAEEHGLTGKRVLVVSMSRS